MQKNIISFLCFIAIIITSLSSCTTTPVCITATNTPLNYKYITENLGKTEGESNSVVSVLGIWMVGRPDIQSAIDNALAKKKGDALINIKCYEEFNYYFAVGITKVRVEGEAVKFYKYEEPAPASQEENDAK